MSGHRDKEFEMDVAMGLARAARDVAEWLGKRETGTYSLHDLQCELFNIAWDEAGGATVDRQIIVYLQRLKKLLSDHGLGLELLAVQYLVRSALIFDRPQLAWWGAVCYGTILDEMQRLACFTEGFAEQAESDEFDSGRLVRQFRDWQAYYQLLCYEEAPDWQAELWQPYLRNNLIRWLRNQCGPGLFETALSSFGTDAATLLRWLDLPRINGESAVDDETVRTMLGHLQPVLSWAEAERVFGHIGWEPAFMAQVRRLAAVVAKDIWRHLGLNELLPVDIRGWTEASEGHPWQEKVCSQELGWWLHLSGDKVWLASLAVLQLDVTRRIAVLEGRDPSEDDDEVV